MARSEPSAIPRMPTAGHTIVEVTGEKNVEARLTALEQQQRQDHAFLNGLVQDLRGLAQVVELQHGNVKDIDTGLQEHARVSFELRKEVFAMKQNFESKNFAPDDVFKVGTGQVIASKLVQIEAIMEVMKNFVESVGAREGKVEQTILEIQGERPIEGQAIREAFQQQSSEISQVKNLVKQFEQNPTAAPGAVVAGNIVFTKEMCDTLGQMYYRVCGLETGAGFTNERIGTVLSAFKTIVLSLVHLPKAGLLLAL